jgi:uncharacterized repeat protein (TIGR02543 family)
MLRGVFMKKNKLFKAGVPALALVLSLVLAGCQNPSDNGTGTGNGGDSNGTGTGGSNPFVGTWTGTVTGSEMGSTAVTLTVTGSNWNLTASEDGGDIADGTYQRSGSSATLMVNGSPAGSASVSGNSLTFDLGQGENGVSGVLTKNSGGAGTSYTVTFDANGGGLVSSQTVSSGESISLPATSRSGYTFNGWYTASSGGTKVGNAGASYTVTGTITLYAQWTASGGGTTSYTVTFDANGGSSVSSQTVDSGESISLPATSRSGYTFNGWYTASSGGTKVGNSGASYTVTGNITLYAQWTASGGGTTKPNAPTGVTATAQSPYSIRISWNAVSGATSYNVYWGIASYSSFTQLLGTTTSTFIVDNDPDTDETWYYKVTAVNSAGESALSSYAYATTPSILGRWYTSQSAANAGTGTPTYEFLANGNFNISGIAAGTFTDNYSASGASGNTVVIKSGGSTLGTATFSLSGTSMTITNAGTSGLSTGTYYKKAK